MYHKSETLARITALDAERLALLNSSRRSAAEQERLQEIKVELNVLWHIRRCEKAQQSPQAHNGIEVRTR